MKLSDFLKGLFGSRVDEANDGIKAVNTAATAKDFTGVLSGVSSVVAAGAKIVEAASADLKALTGGGIPGAEKHEMVKTLVLEAVEPSVEKALPAPAGTQGDFWSGFLKTLLGGVVSILINSFVAKANKDGWMK